jgi:hypothetical protein
MTQPTLLSVLLKLVRLRKTERCPIYYWISGAASLILGNVSAIYLCSYKRIFHTFINRIIAMRSSVRTVTRQCAAQTQLSPWQGGFFYDIHLVVNCISTQAVLQIFNTQE